MGDGKIMKSKNEHSDHLDERTIELYIFRSNLLKDRCADVKKHLNECAGCAALHKEIFDYYAEVEMLRSEQAHKTAHALYAPDRSIRALGHAEKGMIISQEPSVPRRLVKSVRQYPARWLGGLVLLGIVMILLIPRLTHYDRNPSFARARDEFLVVYNKKGDELWRRHIGSGYDAKMAPLWIESYPDHALTTCDVDGDGRNEVLAVFGWVGARWSNSPLLKDVLCFNADGTERWKYEVHRTMVIGGVQYADDYRVSEIMVGDYDRDKHPEVFISASHNPWFPNVIIRLDARDGSFLSEYWHPGGLQFSAQKDLDGDGVDDLLFGGQNNRLGRACVVVFDPRRVEGGAPAPKEYIPQNVSSGSEKYYLIFPPTDLEKGWVDVSNQVSNMTIRSDGLLEVVVWEKLQEFSPEVFYYFDSTMTCVRVRGSDHFTAAHTKLEKEGKLTKTLSEAFYEDLRKSVLYWDGERFVNYPTKVKQSNGIAKKGENDLRGHKRTDNRREKLMVK